MTELSWQAKEVLTTMQATGRLPGVGIPLTQLSLSLDQAVIAKGIPELESAGLITGNVRGEPALTDKGRDTLP